MEDYLSGEEEIITFLVTVELVDMKKRRKLSYWMAGLLLDQRGVAVF